MLEFVNFYLIPGLVLGSIYALGAVGVTLVFGILRFAHVAHGDMLTMGAFLTLAFVQIASLPVLLAAIPGIALTAALAVALDKLFYGHLRGGKAIVLLMASLGVGLMLRSVVQVVWGVDPQAYVSGVIQRPTVIGGLRVFDRHVLIVGGALVLMLALHLFLTRTRLGKAMRAMSDNPTLARLSGIDTGRVIVATWLIAGGLAGVAGTFLGMDGHLHSMMGWNVLLGVFAAAILGGVGNPLGAMVGGLVIGIAEELATYPWIGDEALLSPTYKSGVAFAILIAMLIWRPTGLFRGKVL